MTELTEKVKERRAFDESEGNCNTCKNLIRVTAPKCKFGFLKGVCAHHPSVLSDRNPNLWIDPIMRFHPNDPMHMACYVPRWEQ